MAVIPMDNQEISTVVIPDGGLSQGVAAQISCRNSLLVYGTHRREKTADIKTQYLHEISPRTAVFDDYVRKLVNETHSIFLSFNARIDNCSDDQRRVEIVRISQQYRSVLIACVEDLHNASQSSQDEDLLDLLKMFTDIELLWNLLHTLILEAPAGTRVLYKLLDWIKWHFVPAQKKREELMQSDEPSSHPDYWDVIFQFLLQGNVPPALSLLSLHKKYKREDFVSICDLLQKMPMYNAGYSVSLKEFHLRWKLWQEECRTRLEREEFSTEENLRKICQLLCGDAEILTEKSKLCQNWYHLMISVLLYQNPCINISDLADIARTYYNNVNCESQNKSNLVDKVILAAMELDIKNIINLICTFNDGWWFATHLMDLFSHGDFIENGADRKGYSHTSNFRKYLLRNYGENLMSHPSLWQIGINYIDYSDISCEVYLERIPLKTEALARKILSLAKKRNLNNLVKTVSNVMTAKAMANGKLGTALTWVMHSKDVRYADEIADRWLKDYADCGKREGIEIFRNIGPCMLVSDKLTFVGKYCEFYKLYEDQDLKAAASLLISLIASGLAPPNFQRVLLEDALPLLEAQEVLFSRKDTYRLMECLEEIIKCSKKASIEDSTETDNLIRLALVRNLARCFLVETADSESDDEF